MLCVLVVSTPEASGCESRGSQPGQRRPPEADTWVDAGCASDGQTAAAGNITAPVASACPG